MVNEAQITATEAKAVPVPRIENAPGLTWKPRKNAWEARWQARTDIVKPGYLPKSFHVWRGVAPSDSDANGISQKCRELQTDMLTWSNAPEDARPEMTFADKGCVYFITDGVAIKIGYTTYFDNRFRQLQAANHVKLEILAVLPGKHEDEKAFHRRFSHLRIRGEWFARTIELQNFVNEIRETTRQPIF